MILLGRLFIIRWLSLDASKILIRWISLLVTEILQSAGFTCYHTNIFFFTICLPNTLVMTYQLLQYNFHIRCYFVAAPKNWNVFLNYWSTNPLILSFYMKKSSIKISFPCMILRGTPFIICWLSHVVTKILIRWISFLVTKILQSAGLTC